jgi:hypothetical protein
MISFTKGLDFAKNTMIAALRRCLLHIGGLPVDVSSGVRIPLSACKLAKKLRVFFWIARPDASSPLAAR